MAGQDTALPTDRAAGLRPQPATPFSQSSIPSASELRDNAKALKSWFDSVSNQQSDDIFWGRYSIERRAADALDCAFRLAASSVHALEVVADALDSIAQAIEARSGETERLDLQGESAVATPCAQSHSEAP